MFTQNLRNRLIFKAADEEGALESADFLGKKRVIKKSWGYQSGRTSRNNSKGRVKLITDILARDQASAADLHTEHAGK